TGRSTNTFFSGHLHAHDDRPRAGMVWRGTSVRQPAHGKHSKAVIRLFMQHVKAEALVGIGGIEPLLEPRALRQSCSTRKWANATQDLMLVRRFGGDAPQISN